jgi:aminopeptidase N
MQIVFAQSPFVSESAQNRSLHRFDFEKTALRSQQMLTETSASSWLDVTYYNLSLDLSTQPDYLKGKVRIVGICRQDSSRLLTLDLMNTMRVDSVQVNDRGCPFIQNSSSFDISLDRSYQSGEILSIDVYYEGRPIATGFGSFEFTSHFGVPWVYSLSEPYGAKDWWPCKDDPGDKADSADIIVTCDSTYKVGSQGILASMVNHGDGRSTYHWKERYPIASYLISIAVTNYVQFSNWFRYSAADSMEVLNYVLPEHYSNALENLPRVVDMLSIYSDLFGLYPFIKEKYGHAEFQSGGMEHQTMTSIGTFDENVIAHELAHQWFGDMITCRSWSDLWLNEGFAQYCTALYRERKYGNTSYWEYMNTQLNGAMTAHGEIGAPDTSSASTLFYSPLIYSKGAFVLHMLRHALGDSVFFRSLHAYANQPALRYSTASTKDLQTVCENISGKDLGYFFQEWIYGEGVPDYEYSWNWKSLGDSSILTIDLNQSINRRNPTFFTMPIDVRIITAGRDTTVSIFNNAQRQTFTINFPDKPTSVLLDPDGWILKLIFSDSEFLPSDYILEQNYPNPFNSTTNITYRLPGSAHVTLKIYDLLGRQVATLVDTKQSPGRYEYPWSPQAIASGIYFYRLMAGDIRLQKKMILLR